jgi:hypothetical protein
MSPLEHALLVRIEKLEKRVAKQDAKIACLANQCNVAFVKDWSSDEESGLDNPAAERVPVSVDMPPSQSWHGSNYQSRPN